ncbi:MAG: class I SAM-dependent methyltransferase [Acidobacteria bacterium]|nr:class I SAM-dependent methyltransferase [Acidobacteriota bacterium]
MDPDRTRDYQGEDAAQYESQAAEVGWHGHEIIFGLMYEFIEPDETLLDIGIGTGLGSNLFHRAGLRISGFDNSIEMLEGCKSKGFSGEIIQHDLRDAPFPYATDSFHNILSLAVLNFFEDLAPVFREVARIIRSKGVFGFTVEGKKPGQEACYALRVNRGTNLTKGQREISMYRHSDEQIRDLLEDVGFRVLKEFEFLTDRYPEQGIEVYLKAYVARKECV